MTDALLLGIDIGSSSVKASVVDAATGRRLAATQSPESEMAIDAPQAGWAEQDPALWWAHVVKSVRSCIAKAGADGNRVVAIGISYQMHGLVIVDEQGNPLRPSIIWCDSRAVEIGNNAWSTLGAEFCNEHYLNSPGNFTASKLRWVRENEPHIYKRIAKIMLPGEYIAMQITGEVLTTPSGLSEGILWDFSSHEPARDLMDYYDINPTLLPVSTAVFSNQGRITLSAAAELGISPEAIVSYRAGDQPNNAFSLGVTEPDETAATAGTSGVIYSVTDLNVFDPQSRVNTFVHVSNASHERRNGVLLCVNGTGILNRWLRDNLAGMSYEQMNAAGQDVAIGADGLMTFPFGNGAERILGNKTPGASVCGLDLNRHQRGHLVRASQEGIVFALNYGFEILKSIGLSPSIIKAGCGNMFLSPLFREAFVNTIGLPLELYDTDGATGAALGAGIGAGVYTSYQDAFRGLKQTGIEEPVEHLREKYLHSYQRWETVLNKAL
ncbi:MAG TPA: FGGY family carbohydrate kinase [Cyclobacteriaceae bacterium]|nr:FGGY family carbohydrate kinase [Cyclobacteriaceae bacterium]